MPQINAVLPPENKLSAFPNRYARQLILPQVGLKGQQKLQNARVLVVGTGGLGCPILYYLSAAGVGTIGMVDKDIVDITNLHRQILHWEKDLGRSKVESAQEKLQQLNSEIHFETFPVEFSVAVARKVIPRFDVIISAVDNMHTRRIINKICFDSGKPWIDGGVQGYSGLVTMFRPPQGPCYNCLYPVDIEEKAPGGILGVLPGIIGTVQAQEALKLLLGIGEPLVGKLLMYNAVETRFDMISVKPTPDCPICNNN